MRGTWLIGVSLLCGPAALAQESVRKAEPGPALSGFDPVELTAGKEVKGKPDLSADRGKYRYLFATAENRKAFAKDPERYSIQFGGACMRMGPLAGAGSPGRYFVFDGRIFLFASESCRNAFKANPKRFIDRPDDEPAGSAEAVKRGAAILNRAVEGLGGAKALNDLSTLQVSYQITLKQGDKDFKYTRTASTSFPGTFAFIEDWGTGKGGWLLRPEAGFFTGEKGQPVEAQVRDHMVREFYRQPVHVLKAWQAGEAKAVHVGAGKAGETAVERVAVAVKGATTFLAIDPKTGRVLAAGYRGRGGAGIGDVEKEYSDFRAVGGLVVPFSVRTRVDGKPVVSSSVAITGVRVNEKIDPALLNRPE